MTRYEITYKTLKSYNKDGIVPIFAISDGKDIYYNTFGMNGIYTFMKPKVTGKYLYFEAYTAEYLGFTRSRGVIIELPNVIKSLKRKYQQYYMDTSDGILKIINDDEIKRLIYENLNPNYYKFYSASLKNDPSISNRLNKKLFEDLNSKQILKNK